MGYRYLVGYDGMAFVYKDKRIRHFGTRTPTLSLTYIGLKIISL